MTIDPYTEFQKLLDLHKIVYFTSKEVLYLGASNENGEFKGLNTLPPIYLWFSIVPTLKVIDGLRTHFKMPVIILNGYRNESYNKAIGGSLDSQHMKFTATDIKIPGISPAEIVRQLKLMRVGGVFSGGIGQYKTFVHVDTRGYNADWIG